MAADICAAAVFQHHRLSEITIGEVDAYRAAKVHERDQFRAAREGAEDIPRRPLSNQHDHSHDHAARSDPRAGGGVRPHSREPGEGERRKLKADTPRRSYLDSATQLVALVDAAAQLDREALPHARHIPRRAILATLMFAGLRISELLALRWRAVDLPGGWLSVADSKTAAGVRKVKIRPVLHDVLVALKPVDADPDAYVFATRTGGRQTASQVRNRILAAAVQHANERLPDGEVPLPRLTPHDLRRTFASVLYALGEDPGVARTRWGTRTPIWR